MELVVEGHRRRSREGLQLGKHGDAPFEDSFHGGTGQVCTRNVPALTHLFVKLLNIAIAQEDVLGSLRREGLVSAGMDKRNGELGNTVHVPMVQRGWEARNVEDTQLSLACLLCLVARLWGSNATTLAGVIGRF